MWPASALIVGRASHAIGTSCEELVATTEEELVSFSYVKVATFAKNSSKLT